MEERRSQTHPQVQATGARIAAIHQTFRYCTATHEIDAFLDSMKIFIGLLCMFLNLYFS
uniref:Uncharacterized protein n=1 Tax=Setaria digitata TaxID=48799 RepID=A0A915PTY1_9BILA